MAAVDAIGAATDLLPTMVLQFIDRKKDSEKVLLEQKSEAWARLQQVKQEQQRGTMTSPVDGVILQRHISNERFLDAGRPLVEIGDLGKLQVEADVLSLEVVDTKQGDRVEIYGPAIGPHVADGKVARVYPAGFTKISSLGVEQQRVKVIVDFDPIGLARLRTERDLGVGFRVRVKIVTHEKPNALIVPRSAVFRGQKGQWQVYAINNGRATLREIQSGLINDEHFEVLEGLEEGDQVVLAPDSQLSDGARVRVKP